MEKAKRLGLPGELAAEFAGTMILILFGVGVVAQVVSGGSGGGLGGHDSIAWAWGLGVMFGIYVAGRVTGAHLNAQWPIEGLCGSSGISCARVLPQLCGRCEHLGLRSEPLSRP